MHVTVLECTHTPCQSLSLSGTNQLFCAISRIASDPQPGVLQAAAMACGAHKGSVASRPAGYSTAHHGMSGGHGENLVVYG
jgi:hypothetical protein